jgi:vacuolar-type H+-ATPase subunit I/STV1
MTKLERIEKEISKTKEQIATMHNKLKNLEEQRKMAETAEKMQIIEKHKISSEKLQLLIRISEDELRQLLKEKDKEEEQNEHEEKVIH